VWLAGGVALVALGVRLLYLFQVRDIPFFDYPIGDGRAYYLGMSLLDPVYYQAPLYPYFLGAILSASGDSLWAVYVVQAVLGALSCGLVVWAGALFFSRGAGLLAGGLLALYAPGIFFDGVLQKASLAGFLISVLLVLLGLAGRRPRWGVWLAAGALMGLLGLTRENTLIFVPVVLVWVFAGFRRHDLALRTGWAASCACGLALILLPVAFRNLRAGGSFALTTSQMGANFYIGNNPKADGTYMPLRPGRGDARYERVDAVSLAERDAGRKLTPGEVSHYWLKRALEYIRGHPLEWLALLARKWVMTWNAWEVPDTEDYYLYREYSPLLNRLGLVFHFGVLCPLAVAGVVLWWPERGRVWVLYAMAVGLALSVTAFYVFARYRYPMVLILALSAGAALERGVRLARRRAFGRVAPGAAVCLAVLVAVNLPSPAYEPPSRYNLAYVLAAKGDLAAAERYYRLELLRRPRDPYTHFNLANLLQRRGAREEAVRHYREAIRFNRDPRWASPYVNLAKESEEPESPTEPGALPGASGTARRAVLSLISA